jgi:hypothetical protein
MNVVYRVEVIEHESGWGSKPDGVLYSADRIALDLEIERIQSIGDHSYYRRVGEIGMCIVTDELRDKIGAKRTYCTNKYDDPGVLGFFKPADPKANIETFRKATAVA